MKTKTYNIAFTPSAQLWSTHFTDFKNQEVVKIAERSLLHNISEDAAYLLIHLDPLNDFEKSAIRRLREKDGKLVITGWIAGQLLEDATILSLLDCGINAIITDSYSTIEIAQAFYDAEVYSYHYNHLLGSALLHQWKKSVNHSLLKQLDEREKKAIQLRRQGKTAVEIGNTLHVSHKTIDKLFWKLYQRTGCRNFFELNNALREETSLQYEF
jgi:DNA-binding NarL/FixJ family response regulator